MFQSISNSLKTLGRSNYQLTFQRNYVYYKGINKNRISLNNYYFLKNYPHFQSLKIVNRFNTKNNIHTETNYDFKLTEKEYRHQVLNDLKPTFLKDDDKKDKPFYILAMFPYPSGKLHMGHLRVYTISDVIARYHRLQGREVIHPMGWDAFGLPAENAAVERGITPKTWTEGNVSNMREQFDNMHAAFDWDREVNTSSSKYYQFTQELVLNLYEKGLLYRKKAQVNWDPIDKTVLANEQVDNEGRSWRSGAKVEKKWLEQWFIKISALREELLDDLELLEQWPNHVKAMQRNWIGKSEGVEVVFPLINHSMSNLNVFTSRIETLAGVTYLAIAPSHPLLDSLSDDIKERAQNIKASQDPLDKQGFLLPIQAINPLTKETIPIFVANYVLDTYGSGAVMGVPAHDARDFAFAESQSLPKTSIKPVLVKQLNDIQSISLPYVEEEGVLLIDQPKGLAGLPILEGREQLFSYLKDLGIAEKKVNYRLRDWLISRQRYWGAPIPFIHCSKCGTLPVPKGDLPVLLPENPPTLQGVEGTPLEQDSEFINCKCPKCNGIARRDGDTLDTFVDSAWYYLNYLRELNCNEKGKLKAFDLKQLKEIMPVDIYIGGVEHAILHLLYARFIAKVVSGVKGDLNLNEKDQNKQLLWDFGGEPFKRLITQGMVQGKTYKVASSGQFVRPDLVRFNENQQPIHKETNQPLIISYEKMSKSKYNGVEPNEVLNKYGVDATRLYILFKVAPEENLDWEEESIIGMQRFLQKIYRLCQFKDQFNNNKLLKDIKENELNESMKSLIQFYNQSINLINLNFENEMKLNVCVSQLMKLTNELMNIDKKDINPSIYNHLIQNLIIMLYPFAPTSSKFFWNLIQPGLPLLSWPKPLNQFGNVMNLEIVIQIQGKKRGQISLDSKFWNLEKETELKALLLEKIHLEDSLNKFVEGKSIKKWIIVKKAKLVNLIL